MNPKEYFWLAQELLKIPTTDSVTSEAKLRSAISRAYYAAFLLAREYLETQTHFRATRTGEDHLLVKREFKSHNTDGKWRRIGRGLELLLENRTFADYNDPIPEIQDLAEASIDEADAVIKLLTGLNKNN